MLELASDLCLLLTLILQHSHIRYILKEFNLLANESTGNFTQSRFDKISDILLIGQWCTFLSGVFSVLTCYIGSIDVRCSVILVILNIYTLYSYYGEIDTIKTEINLRRSIIHMVTKHGFDYRQLRVLCDKNNLVMFPVFNTEAHMKSNNYESPLSQENSSIMMTVIEAQLKEIDHACQMNTQIRDVNIQCRSLK